MPIVPSFDSFLLHVQDAGYNFAIAPFSSRPGVYKGAIGRKMIFFYCANFCIVFNVLGKHGEILGWLAFLMRNNSAPNMHL